jgi:AcrR family transcriptional regulator
MARISQELKDQTRICILREAETLFNTFGYEQTKTKAIAKACQIAEGTLFNYFENKEEILLAVFDQMANIDDNLIQLEKIKEDMIIDVIMYPVKKLKKYNKSFLIDLTTASLKIAKKNKKLFKSLVALDYKYMEELDRKLSQYFSFDKSLISSFEMSEMVYAVVASEFILYLYEKERTYDDFESKATRKIKALIKPYIGEE